MLINNKHPNHYNFYKNHESIDTFKPRANHPHQNAIQFKLKQNIKKEIVLLSQQHLQVYPEKHNYPVSECQNDNPSHYKHSFLPQQLDNNPSSFTQKIGCQIGFGDTHHQHGLDARTDLYEEDWHQNECVLNDTGEIMDRKFNELLQMNCMENNIGIQSKFIIMKSQKYLKDLETDTDDRLSPNHTNTHQRLLEEENYYIRDQLIQFTQHLRQNKTKYQELKQTNKIMKKEIMKLKQQIKGLGQVKNEVLAQLIKKEEAYLVLFSQYQQQQKVVDNLSQINLELRMQLRIVEKECQQRQEKQQKRQRYIESIEQQRLRLKEEYHYCLSQKQKEIHELNEFINHLKQQNEHHATEDNSQQLKNSQESKLFEDGSNSICLSLAQAQSLKNIIQQKQQLHKAEINMLKQHHYQAEQSLIKQLEKVQSKISEIQNLSQLYEEDLKKRQSEYLDTDSDGQQDGQNKLQCLKRKIKSLKIQLFKRSQEKAQLLQQVSYLQQCCHQKQEDQQIQQLLQNCVDELQKSRKLNFLLTNENSYLKQLFYKQHNQENKCIYT